MNEQIQELRRLPQNQLRKAFAMKACILELAKQEYEAAMAALRSREDASELLDKYFEEA